MKKNNKTDKEYTDKLDPTEEELLVDDIDILDIDDDDIGIDTNFIDVDLNKDDEETDFVTENEEKDHRDTIQADINVVVCRRNTIFPNLTLNSLPSIIFHTLLSLLIFSK